MNYEKEQPIFARAEQGKDKAKPEKKTAITITIGEEEKLIINALKRRDGTSTSAIIRSALRTMNRTRKSATEQQKEMEEEEQRIKEGMRMIEKNREEMKLKEQECGEER